MDKKRRDLTIACLASGLLVLAGCGESGGPAGPPGAHPMLGPPGAPRPGAGSLATGGIGPAASVGIAPPNQVRIPDKAKPAVEQNTDKPDSNPLASVLKVEAGGNLVSLASDIIAAGVNPFLSRLPRPIQPETGNADTAGATQAGQPTPPAVANPLDAIKLVGIVYNPKSAIALVSVTGAQAATQLVRTGDVIPLDGGQVLIGRITQSAIDVQLLGPKKEKRTMPIPDIIGYNASGSSASDGGSGGESEDPSSFGGSSAPSGAPSSSGRGLSNLKKLTTGLTDSSGASAKGPNVVLTEP